MYAFATSVIAMPNDGKPASFYAESSGPMTTPPPPTMCPRSLGTKRAVERGHSTPAAEHQRGLGRFGCHWVNTLQPWFVC